MRDPQLSRRPFIAGGSALLALPTVSTAQERVETALPKDAAEALDGPTSEPSGIRTLVDLIEPGLPRPLPGRTREERIRLAIEANVRWSIKQLVRLPGAKQALDAGRVSLIGAVYELATGRVRFLSE